MRIDPLKRWAGPLAALLILCLNIYICRELFWSGYLAYLNSMHGVWMALARLAGSRWWLGGWWPYWDGGMPFEYTYAPLIPALTAFIAYTTGSQIPTAFHALTGLVYCMAPVTLYTMAWRITGAVGPSVVAALSYSLLSPASLLAPDAQWRLAGLGQARQLYLAVVWDELPHLTALTLLPLAVLLLVRAARESGWGPRLMAAVIMALMMLASTFATTILLLMTGCLLAAVDRAQRKQLCITVAWAGCLAYLTACPYLPPSLILLIRDSQALHGEGWNLWSFWGAGMFLVGGALVRAVAYKLRAGWWTRFLALFAYGMSMIAWLHGWLNWRLLPQPGRYKVEMEMAWALLGSFVLCGCARRLPRTVRVASLVPLLLLGWQQVVHHRRFAKEILSNRPKVTDTIEYRIAVWLKDNLPEQRIFLPGSAAQWLNTFVDNVQYSGGNWSTAMNRQQQVGHYTILSGENLGSRDAEISLLWLKAFGVGAVVVTGPRSTEFWKPFRNPAKFDGLLPVLWREDDTTVYKIPRHSNSLAHFIPPDRLVTHEPANGAVVDELERYVDALDRPMSPQPEIRMQTPDHFLIRAPAGSQVLSLQVAYHPGWEAAIGDVRVPVLRDGLGQIWLEPRCAGPCEVALWYEAGVEAKLCRIASAGVVAGTIVFFVAAAFNRGRNLLLRG